jgi:DNA polymerase III sliding clamp (beta) subunit (PCNA family)
MLNEESLILNQRDLAAVIKRVRVTADPESYSIYLAIRPTKVGKMTKWHLTVTARDQNRNSSQESLDIEYRGGTKAREICVNHKHLLELLDCLISEQVEFKLGEKNAPVYVQDGSFSGLVNPMMISLR